METDSGSQAQVVDPEVRAYIYSLLTALGGTGGSDTGQYVLGDDALACLRDIKKWLKFYDEKANRMDVARCLAEAELVNRDLLPILALYGDAAQDDKHKSRILLACLELLVPLTWPLEIHSQMTVNHHRHTPYLRHSQVMYKRGILGHGTSQILRAVIRIALPSVTIPRSERSSRDEGILKLMLYLFRNIAIITPSPHLAGEGDEEEASRSATITTFHRQDVFALLLTMCSNMGEDFTFQDVIILEILFHLVKGVDAKSLFSNDKQHGVMETNALQGILEKEDSVKREYSKNAPTRHNRFGTMIWVKRGEEKMSTVSGQDILKDERTALLKMDKTKKWNKPKGRRNDVDVSINNFNVPTTLTSSAAKHLRTFVGEFLDSGFNPLFTQLRKAIEREADRVTEATQRQFFYVISWFLEAERARRTQQKELRQRNQNARDIEPDSFGLVASVLNQETFIALSRWMQTFLDNKEWQDVNATMRCFTQILLTVQEMSASPLDEDQEIAENIQNRIFYEETTHDRILSILRNYKDQGFWYLDSCTELAYVFLRMLEQYSKQNVDMQVRSRRRGRRKKAAEAAKDQNNPEGGESESEADDTAEATRTAVERSFDFKRFAPKFCTQKSVNTFIAFTSFYRELNLEQLKRIHRFFYRVAFKQDLSVLLFRVDIISLFYKMIKGPDGLDPTKPIFREWEEFVRQIIKKLIKKLDQRPELIVEMLFSKINATVHYLEYGYEKQTVSSESKPAMELEVKPTAATTLDEKMAIVVSALVSEGKENLVKWLCQSLESAVNERRSWELEAEARKDADSGEAEDTAPKATSTAVTPADDACRTAMFRNGRLRLLMTLAGLQILGGEDVLGATWIIASALSSSTIEETLKMIQKHCENPSAEINGEDPRDLLRRKRVAHPDIDPRDSGFVVDFGDDSEGEDNVDLDGVLFPANIRTKSNALDELKKKRRKRRGGQDDDEANHLDDETLEARRLAREKNALDRQRKIKSDLYIHASDEESDDEADKDFFAREEERRQQQANRVRDALMAARLNDGESTSKKKKSAAGRKRTSTSAALHDDDDDDDMDSDDGKRKRRKSDSPSLLDGDDDEDDDVIMEQPSSVQARTSRQETPPTSTEDDLGFGFGASPSGPFHWSSSLANRDAAGIGSGEKAKASVPADEDEDEDDVPVARAPRRSRVMAGFVVDSDSE
ncbi:hypothetical protein AJ80_07121 [Polytolypa hystricis UAMH7299]|uniref:Topoisomerase 1-associated factor 1 n=1 Tax=Polytolypa hystricis (strain UAMH7299) TaxID=1447883 RepID=A0A2B7XS37_POLH7|nr:hypothetical protein AJ80_07121 [Polytolypa hystricis UAMH7299]